MLALWGVVIVCKGLYRRFVTGETSHEILIQLFSGQIVKPPFAEIWAGLVYLWKVIRGRGDGVEVGATKKAFRKALHLHFGHA